MMMGPSKSWGLGLSAPPAPPPLGTPVDGVASLKTHALRGEENIEESITSHLNFSDFNLLRESTVLHS